MIRAIFLLLAVLAIGTACQVSTLSTTANSPTQVLATPETLPTVSKTANTANRTAQVTALQSLNVRSGPSMSDGVIGYLYKGDPVVMTGDCVNGWARVKWQSARAWVYARYLSDNICEESK